jgi:hypothetical protein
MVLRLTGYAASRALSLVVTLHDNEETDPTLRFHGCALASRNKDANTALVSMMKIVVGESTKELLQWYFA